MQVVHLKCLLETLKQTYVIFKIVIDRYQINKNIKILKHCNYSKTTVHCNYTVVTITLQ